MIALKLQFDFGPKLKQIVNDKSAQAVSDAFDDWLKPILLPMLMEASPVDEIPEDPKPGALRRSHFAKKQRGENKTQCSFGIRVTNDTVANSIRRNRPQGFFYGLWLHETDGWSPRFTSGGLVGPKWITRTSQKALPILKDIIRLKLQRRRTFGFTTTQITEYVVTGDEI